MKTWFLLLSLCLPAAAQDAPLEVFRVPNFNCGVVTRYSPILIGDNCVQDARNVYFDEQGVSRRKGYAQFNSAPFTDLKSVRMVAPFTSDDGTRYIVALSSKTLYSAPTTGVFTAISGMPNFSDIADMDAVAYLGKIWFANGVDSMAYWTGAATATVTEAPLGGMIEGWRNRIVTAGVAGSLSYVYMSEELNGEEWTTGPTTSIAPVAIAFGGINAKPIRCVYGGFKDFLFVANEDETYGVYGFGRNDFVVRTISREVGCIEDKSVQEKDGALYWMSRSGIEKMTTQGGIQRISDGVKDVFDELISNTAVNRTKLYTTQAHWEAGNLTASGAGAPISATISPGSLVPSTWSHANDTGTDWGLGESVGVDTTSVDGSITLSSQPIANFSLDKSSAILLSNGSVNLENWTMEAVTNPLGGVIVTKTGSSYYNRNCSISSPTGYKAAGANFKRCYSTASGLTPLYSIEILDASDDSVVYKRQFQNAADDANRYCTEYELDISTYTQENIKIKFVDDRLPDNYFLSAGFRKELISGGLLKYLNGVGIESSDCGSNFSSANGVFDFPELNYVGVASWTSGAYNTTFSTPIGGPYHYEHTIPAGSTVGYQIAQSDDGINFDPWVTIPAASSDTYRIPFVKQYWKEKISLSTSYSTQTPSVEYTALSAATTGEYIHECAQIDSISSWGNFQANSVLDGGSISYFVSTGTTCDSVQQTTANWTAQSNNAPITISTAAYLGIKELFTIDAATQTALLRDVTINWLEGTARPPVASSVYLNRYYLAYTTSTVGNTNDFMFVADKNDAVTFLDNMNCYSLGLFNRKMFCGDATATGKIYQMETGESDDGEAFTSYVRTKAYHFGDPDAEKEFVKMYAAFAPEAESILDINITPAYSLDLSTSVISLNPVNTGEDSTAGMLVAKIPFAVSNNLTGRFLDVKFSNTSNTGGWTMFGLSFYLRRYDVK